MELPFISVILPTFNRASTLMRAVGSVLDQDYRAFELSIVDDGST
ncbi:MAG: glycosyltransferase family 2 protein, partial [Alphaproteobacteria bacterium]